MVIHTSDDHTFYGKILKVQNGHFIELHKNYGSIGILNLTKHKIPHFSYNLVWLLLLHQDLSCLILNGLHVIGQIMAMRKVL